MITSPAELTLYDALDSVLLRPFVATAGDEVMCRTWSLGAPDVRYTSVERPGADGVDEGPGYLGSRTVTFDLVLMGNDAYATLDRLIAFTHPARQPTLQVRRATGPTAGQAWVMRMRGNPYSIEFGRRAAALLELQLSFTAPAPYLIGAMRTFSTSAGEIVPATDWLFPAGFPKTFGAGTSPYPRLTIDVGGSSPVHPMIYISGPVSNPEIRTDEGDRFRFTGLTLIAGQTVQIDMAAGTIRRAESETFTVNEDADLYSAVDWTVSRFWRWNVGLHHFQYRATSGTATIQFRERRLSI